MKLNSFISFKLEKLFRMVEKVEKGIDRPTY